MNDQFDELAKGLAQSVTRRVVLKQFGLGLAGVVLAALGMAINAEAGTKRCNTDADCPRKSFCAGGFCRRGGF